MSTETGTGTGTATGPGTRTGAGAGTGAGTEGASVLVRGAGQGPATWALGSVFERLASHEETAGSFGLSLVTQPAGTATPVHIHTEEDEAFYLLGGTTTYSADGQIHRLSRGSFIFLPRGLPHAFRVTSSDPVRFLALADVGRWLEAAPRYGLRIVGPPLPEDA